MKRDFQQISDSCDRIKATDAQKVALNRADSSYVFDWAHSFEFCAKAF
jgi:hypothetical protein